MAVRIVAIAVAAALAGCSAADAKTLVRYSRSGGFAGMSQSLVVGTGGSARAADQRAGENRKFKLTDRQLGALKRALKAAKFSTLQPRYVPRGVVNDGITETVTHKGKTVTVETGGSPPERLTKLLSRLARLADRAPSTA